MDAPTTASASARENQQSAFLFDAFVSYRRSDGGRVARWIRRELQSFRPPATLRDRMPKRLRVYLDTAYERGTTDFFQHTILPALRASRHLIVVATPDAVRRSGGADDWLAREIEEFSRGPVRENIFVVRGAGSFDGPLPGDLATRYPNAEIIDLRDVGRFWYLHPTRAARLSDEKLKLIAPIIGLAPQDMPLLRREEERIQQTRMGVAAGAVLAVLVAVSTLTAYALTSRWSAARALESSLSITGRLIGSIGSVPDLRRAPENLRGNLLNEACDVFDKLRAEAGADPRAGPLVTCFSERAAAHERLKEIDAAKRLLESALAGARDAYRRSNAPDDGRDLARAFDALTDFYRRQGNSEGQAHWLKRADEAIEKLIAAHPDHSSFLEARADNLNALADFEGARGRLAERLAALDQAAASVGSAAEKNIEQDRARLLSRRGRLMMFAADPALRAGGTEAALVRLAGAAAAFDGAAALGHPDRTLSIDAAAVFAMIAELHRAAGRAVETEAAKTEGRNRLARLESWLPKEQAERERLQRIRAVLTDGSGAGSR